MELLDALPAYEDMWGMMLDRNKVVDGNSLLYSGTRIVLLNDQYKLSRLEYVKFHSALAQTEVQFGLLSRYSKPNDHETQDDYVGMLAASAVLDEGNFAKRVLQYGRAHWYSWDNLTPGKWSLPNFFVRFPGFWAHAKAAAGEWLNPFDQLMSFADLSSIVFYENGSSGTLLTYLRYKTYLKQCKWRTHPLTRLGCVIFKTGYFRRHPKGIKESYIDYFGPDYPFSQLEDGTF